MADRDKPLKTALVRETETRTARAEAAATHRSVRARQQTGELSKKFSESQQSTKAFMRLQSAAETGEAQAFVGKMKPGVKARTDLHSINDWAERMEIRREASYKHQHQKPGDTWGHTKTYVKDESFKDLGEAVPGAAEAQGLRARAETRATRQKRSEASKAAGKGAAGSGPRITETFDDKHDLTQIPGGWGKLRPGDL